ncbi:hypothetical protein NIES37_67030 [Tolypothrix tenuis PCC 7101]|uniref:Uncharacterized protein n=1 Tax=Tolypothrix tenuis PCC 7101 TaxID=231146 RepID=A0A1Z4NAF5_9CYAN|nr:hypothetical protein NIES37_67030 [Tolypothrix tenuis PCC 7101]BAZ78417.1 hypothetical protein NIES50_70500 [Aulosira laxa NIES-50]
MIDLALATLTNTSGKVHHKRLETWKAQSEQADLVASRLAFQYVESSVVVHTPAPSLSASTGWVASGSM